MGDSYQAIYDAVRSRISSATTHDILSNAAREAFDISHARALLQEQICMVANEIVRPSAVYRPALSIDGDQWCALYGANLQEGCAGYGPTPDAAMRDFDQAWVNQRPRR